MPIRYAPIGLPMGFGWGPEGRARPTASLWMGAIVVTAAPPSVARPAQSASVGRQVLSATVPVN